jgi:hypothetical protein
VGGVSCIKGEGMPAKLPKTKKRQAVFTTLRPDEKKRVEQQAEATGMTVSNTIRMIILRDLNRVIESAGKEQSV